MNTTLLAFLLALGDFSDDLNEQEQENLKKVAQQLKTQPKAWTKYTEPILLETIKANSQLNQAYQFYKDKLEKLEVIPSDLLPKDLEINQLLKTKVPATAIARGFAPTAPATGYDQQINNAVIVISQSAKPEQTVKELKSLGKMKQFLNQPSQ